jgi:uncharacterized membrane protein
MTINSIDAYLIQLREALEGCDAAIIQDALTDAEEHLRTALDSVQESQPGISQVESVGIIIADYGVPDEIADAYREIEAYTRPVLAASPQRSQGNILARFFGIYINPGAWGALVYMLITILIGTLYFTWAVMGVSLSLVFGLFIFGLLFAAFFVLSVKGMALMEGRIVEALLGMRMPRRTVFAPPDLTWRKRLTAQLTDKQTWLIIIYMILQMPLGVIYFTLFVILIALSLMLIFIPIITSGFGLPVAIINDTKYFAPVVSYPFSVLLGILMATFSLHFAKFLGNLHGRYAKKMLVGD